MTTIQNPANENHATSEGVQDNPVNSTDSEDNASTGMGAVKQQESEISQLKEEVAKLKDQWVRAVAETDNIRKRTQKEKEEASKYAINTFAADMVTILETLKRASESIPSGEGVDLTLQELLNIFQRYQITRVDPKDKKFDHNFHQAVAQVERDDVPAGTVIQVIQAGYMIHDRLLRPAMVVVSKAVDPANKVDTTA